jgi:hypothetical protein
VKGIPRLCGNSCTLDTYRQSGSSTRRLRVGEKYLVYLDIRPVGSIQVVCDSSLLWIRAGPSLTATGAVFLVVFLEGDRTPKPVHAKALG